MFEAHHFSSNKTLIDIIYFTCYLRENVQNLLGSYFM